MFLIWALEERPRVTGSSTELLLRRWRMRRPSPPKRLATQNVINVTAPKMQAARIVVSSILDLDGCELSNCDEAGDLQSDGRGEELLAGVGVQELSGVSGIQGIRDCEHEHAESTKDVAGAT